MLSIHIRPAGIPGMRYIAAGHNAVQSLELVERAFYQGKGAEVASIDQKERSSAAEQAAASGIDAELLMKILSNPEMVKVLQMLSKTVG